MPPPRKTPPVDIVFRAMFEASAPRQLTKMSMVLAHIVHSPELAYLEMTTPASVFFISSATAGSSTPRPVSRRNL